MLPLAHANSGQPPYRICYAAFNKVAQVPRSAKLHTWGLGLNLWTHPDWFPRFTQIEPWNIWFTIDWYTRWYIYNLIYQLVNLPLIYPWFTLFTNWDQIENLIQPLADLTKDCRFRPLRMVKPQIQAIRRRLFGLPLLSEKNTSIKFQMDPICKSKKKRSFKHKFHASHAWACYQCYHFWKSAFFDVQSPNFLTHTHFSYLKSILFWISLFVHSPFHPNPRPPTDLRLPSSASRALRPRTTHRGPPSWLTQGALLGCWEWTFLGWNYSLRIPEAPIVDEFLWVSEKKEMSLAVL